MGALLLHIHEKLRGDNTLIESGSMYRKGVLSGDFVPDIPCEEAVGFKFQQQIQGVLAR